MSELTWAGGEVRIEYRDGSECAGHILEQLRWDRETHPRWLTDQTGPLGWLRSFMVHTEGGCVKTILMAERDPFFAWYETLKFPPFHPRLVPSSLVMIDVTDGANREVTRMHVRPKESAIAP